MAGLLPDERPLELEESELFEDDDVTLEMSPSAPATLAQEASAKRLPAAAAPPNYGESDSDDDGIVLESECSSSEADDVEDELVSRIQSLQSSLENAAPVQEQGDPTAYPAAVLGTSQASHVGSLKSFGNYYKGKRLFSSDSDLAASLPVTAPMHAGRRKVAPMADKSFNLGTSMPISIPMMPRRNSSGTLTLEEARGQHATTFVPPHMLHRQENSDVAGLFAEPSLGLSPSGGAKREKLLARNAILRSTGFIEVQNSANLGSVLDPVKEHLLSAMPSTAAMAVPHQLGDSISAMRATPRSSLTRMLGTSK